MRYVLFGLFGFGIGVVSSTSLNSYLLDKVFTIMNRADTEDARAIDTLVSSNDTAVNAWACEYVNARSDAKDGGCYDACLARAVHVDVPVAPEGHPLIKGRQALFVSFEDHGNNWANACAVVLHGAEY